MITKESNKRVQANVDRLVAQDAEEVMSELGLTPTVVINALYKKIIATGEIPFSFSLTAEQKANLKIRQLSRNKPVKEIKTDKDLEDFFNED